MICDLDENIQGRERQPILTAPRRPLAFEVALVRGACLQRRSRRRRGLLTHFRIRAGLGQTLDDMRNRLLGQLQCRRDVTLRAAVAMHLSHQAVALGDHLAAERRSLVRIVRMWPNFAPMSQLVRR
jgi:hypothetical protein